MAPALQDKVFFVLSAEKTVRETKVGHGECLACGATGRLQHRLGTLWEVGHRDIFKDELVHVHWCPLNRILLSSQHPEYKSNYTRIKYQRKKRGEV